MLRGVALAIVLAALFMWVPASHAQIEAPRLILRMTPTLPKPGERVRVSVQSYVLPLQSAVITWYVNGKKTLSSEGAVELEIAAGPLGSKTEIEARVGEESTSLSFRPASVVLLWESDSFVPPFYRGRALPSMGTRLRLEARAHFVESGKEIEPQNIIYTWRRNGLLVPEASGRGKSSAIVSAPQLFATDVIAVEAQSTGGAFRSEATLAIPETGPKLLLYEDHPLYGIFFTQALGAQSEIPHSEMSFVAIPYFSDSENVRDPRLLFEWIVNGKPILPDPNNRNRITISSKDERGVGDIALSLFHSENIFESAEGIWRIILNAVRGESTSASDPFRPPVANVQGDLSPRGTQ